MSGSGLCNSQAEELLQYFSSYLTDTTAAIADIKNLMYELIDIELPLAKGLTVPSDILSIMGACRRSYDDLRRTEAILRGHVRAKRGQRLRAFSQPGFSRVRENQHQDYLCSSQAKHGFRNTFDTETLTDTPMAARKHFETMTTMGTQPTDSDRRGFRGHIPKLDLGRDTGHAKASRYRENSTREQDAVQGLNRTRSMEILKKVEDIRSSQT
jgi:hypothetical protein